MGHVLNNPRRIDPGLLVVALFILFFCSAQLWLSLLLLGSGFFLFDRRHFSVTSRTGRERESAEGTSVAFALVWFFGFWLEIAFCTGDL